MFLHKGHGLPEEDIGTVPLMRFLDIVAEQHGVVVMRLGIVDAGQRGIKATVFRTVVVGHPQMPFSEHSGRISGALQHLSHGGGIQTHLIPGMYGMGYFDSELMNARHQSGPGWGAGGADTELFKADTLVMQTVEVGGLNHLIPMSRHIPIAHVIDKEENNVGGCCVTHAY